LFYFSISAQLAVSSSSFPGVHQRPVSNPNLGWPILQIRELPEPVPEASLSVSRLLPARLFWQMV